ncbi:serpin H1-like [Dermacentor variabilis]|uniref:serpin H1-like n=1 Tax=Dermacentor variabilis TaxID=34621 RepID=UPI003F5AF12C
MREWPRIGGASEQRERNTLLSPLALALSFAVVLEGSVAGTIDRILETLHWQLLRDPDIRYVMARSLHRLSQLPNDSVRVEAAAFVQRDFDVVRAYRESLDTYYGADVLLVNFLDQRAALVAINSWACRVTSRVILRLLLDKTSEIDSKSRFVATAVLTLKLAFDRPFLNPKVQLPFFTSPVESQSVESMYTTGTFGYKRNTDRGFDAVALPLLSGNLSLLLLMPVDGSTLAAVRKTLVTHPDLLLNLEAEMDPTIVEVTLPRFKVTAVCGLKSALTSLGHDFLFDRFKTNMGAVSRHGHAYVSNILNAVSLDVGPITTTTTTSGHDTDAPVNEATDASMTNPAVSFHVNKPFIYVVADKTDGLPLAVGQFVDPSGTANEATSKL